MSPAPRALLDRLDDRRVSLDVREDIRAGREPFVRIMNAVKALTPEEVLVVRAPFEPCPLYEVLARRGYAHWTESHGPDDWSVWFYRDAAKRAAPPGAARAAISLPIVLDVRGLEPPQPMLKVLAQLECLAPDAALEVRHDRRPVFLYPQLEERGFTHETDEPEPGYVRIRIRKA
jgi:uncharacterized protein (DUF2249 family)